MTTPTIGRVVQSNQLTIMLVVVHCVEEAVREKKRKRTVKINWLRVRRLGGYKKKKCFQRGTCLWGVHVYGLYGSNRSSSRTDGQQQTSTVTAYWRPIRCRAFSCSGSIVHATYYIVTQEIIGVALLVGLKMSPLLSFSNENSLFRTSREREFSCPW